MIAETYLQLITDPAHIAFELTLEAATGLVIYPFARFLFRKWLARHDKEVHGARDSA